MRISGCDSSRARKLVGEGQAQRGDDGKSEGISFPNKNWIFEHTKALEICRWRFRRNFDMGIFLNSSRLPKDFRKI
jgi:hypothetical protein